MQLVNLKNVFSTSGTYYIDEIRYIFGLLYRNDFKAVNLIYM